MSQSEFAARAGVAQEQARRGRVRASTPEDAAAVFDLMCAAGLWSNSEPQPLHWKYWQQRSEWTGSRSYVLTDGRAVMAHGAVIPAALITETGRLQMAHVIDWAARRGEAGAGVAVLKHLGRFTDGLYAIGGSADSLRILPEIGYRTCGTVTGYVRPLTAGYLWREGGGRSWRIAARMARSMLWRLATSRPSLEGWSALRLSPREIDRLASVFPQPRRGIAVFERSVALFRYMLTCPVAPMTLYALEYAGCVRGYFLFVLARGQTRLADAWVDSDELTDWRALVGCAVREARRRREAAELVAWASDPLLSRALANNGFHARFNLPIMLRSGAREIPQPAPRVQMLDNDSLYLHAGSGQLWA